MITQLSRKQIEFMATELSRINILHGSIRSGKTVVSLFKFALEVSTYPKDAVFLMAGVTLDTLERNCLNILEDILPTGAFVYSLGKKIGYLYGRLVYLEGANDIQSKKKIRGMTLTGAYLDEVSLHNKDFVRTVNGRLSKPKAFMIATTNPEEPTHWFKKDYIDAEGIDKKVWHFVLEDNITLDEDYIKNVKAEYLHMGNAYYSRYILGLWVRAEGAVYSQFCESPSEYIIDEVDKSKISFIQIGIDFGGNGSQTAFVATAFMNDYGIVVLESERVPSDNLNPERLNQKFYEFYNKVETNYPNANIRYIFADSAEQVLIRGLKTLPIPVTIRNSIKNEINQRIRCLNGLIAKDKFKVQKRCQSAISALNSAVWKETKTGADERLDDGSTDIDTLDALEYSFENELKMLTML